MTDTTAPLVFLDTETTSLHRPCSPTPGEIWEVALIVRDQTGEHEYRWLLPVTMEHADPVSLDISGFHQRHPQGDHTSKSAALMLVPDLHLWADDFAELTHGAHLVGNVISFDEERLAALLMAHGVQPGWHYHTVDVEALAAGRLGLAPPWDSEDLCRHLGVEPPSEEDRHTALGDARWAAAIYDAAMHTASSEDEARRQRDLLLETIRDVADDLESRGLAGDRGLAQRLTDAADEAEPAEAGADTDGD